MRNPHLKSYETTFILGEDATDAQAKEKLASLTTVITDFGGTVSKSEFWGKRELAYPIKRNLSGFYTTFWFDLPTDKVAQLEKILRFDESVLRSLVTLAYTSAQPGSLYPVKEEDEKEKPARSKRSPQTTETTEPASAEEELRRSSTTTKPSKKAPKVAEGSEDNQSDEERMQKLDEALGDILKDEA